MIHHSKNAELNTTQHWVKYVFNIILENDGVEHENAA